MRRYLFAIAAAAALAFTAVVPAPAKASWLSEALHRRLDPYYYAPSTYYYGDYYAPAYDYYADPVYVSPPAINYSTPYYYAPATSFYWWSGPRYYGHRGWYGGHHGWYGGHRGWHGGHHRR